MQTETVSMALEIHRPIGTSPANHTGESDCTLGRGAFWPLGEDDRLRGRDPVDATGGDRAVSRADALTDGDVRVVAREDVGQSKRVPHLAESRIGVEEHTPARGGEDLPIVAEAHHVEQEVGVAHPLQHLCPGPADVGAVVESDAPRLLEPDTSHDVAYVVDPSVVPVDVSLEVVDEQDVPAELAESEE